MTDGFTERVTVRCPDCGEHVETDTTQHLCRRTQGQVYPPPDDLARAGESLLDAWAALFRARDRHGAETDGVRFAVADAMAQVRKLREGGER